MTNRPRLKTILIVFTIFLTLLIIVPTSAFFSVEKEFENTIRPKEIDDFAGQPQLIGSSFVCMLGLDIYAKIQVVQGSCNISAINAVTKNVLSSISCLQFTFSFGLSVPSPHCATLHSGLYTPIPAIALPMFFVHLFPKRIFYRNFKKNICIYK